MPRIIYGHVTVVGWLKDESSGCSTTTNINTTVAGWFLGVDSVEGVLMLSLS